MSPSGRFHSARMASPQRVWGNSWRLETSNGISRHCSLSPLHHVPVSCLGNLAKKEERNGVRELQSLEKVRVGVDCAACRILSADKISTGPSEITETNTLEHSNDDLENGGAAGTMVFGKDGP